MTPDNPHDIHIVEVTISDGQTTSSVVALLDNAVVGVETDAAFDGTQLDIDMGSEPARVVTSSLGGSPVSVVISSEQFAPLNPQITLGCAYVKLVSNAAQSGADTVIRLSVRAY